MKEGDYMENRLLPRKCTYYTMKTGALQGQDLEI